MPHADATSFQPHLTKPEAYAQLLDSLESLFSGTRFWPTNLANTASLLWHFFHSLPAPSNAVNWAGFYVSDTLHKSHNQGGELLLGPFMGRVACQKIRVGKGVCGTAAEKKETQVVADVEAFPGHIACDGETKSEIVVPILTRQGKCIGVIDIDCTELSGFDEEDRQGLEAVARLLSDACDWGSD